MGGSNPNLVCTLLLHWGSDENIARVRITVSASRRGSILNPNVLAVNMPNCIRPCRFYVGQEVPPLVCKMFLNRIGKSKGMTGESD